MNALRMWWARLTGQPVVWVEQFSTTVVRIAKPHPDGKRWVVKLSGYYGTTFDVAFTASGAPHGWTGGWVIPPLGVGKTEAEKLDEALAECDRLLTKIGKTHETYRGGK